MLIEQDLTTKVGMIGRLQARRKLASSREWEQIWEKPIKNKVVNAGLATVAHRITVSYTHLTLPTILLV